MKYAFPILNTCLSDENIILTFTLYTGGNYNESVHSSYDTYREGTSGNLGDAVDGEGSYLGGGEGSNL